MDLLPFTRPSIGPEEQAAVAAVLASGCEYSGQTTVFCNAKKGNA
jgi:hypothetical protein